MLHVCISVLIFIWLYFLLCTCAYKMIFLRVGKEMDECVYIGDRSCKIHGELWLAEVEFEVLWHFILF